MGYTHYWEVKRPIRPDEWLEIVKGAHAIVAAAEGRRIALAGWNGNGAPLIGEGKISLNGAGEEACETFGIEATATGFDFCKTRREPYDLVVCAILLRCKSVLGDGFRVNSDGHWDDEDEWLPARQFYSEALGVTPHVGPNPLEDS